MAVIFAQQFISALVFTPLGNEFPLSIALQVVVAHNHWTAEAADMLLAGL
jgi:hypothetical protein